MTEPNIPAPPANATEANARLGTLTENKEWGGRLLAGDAAATKEWKDLTALAAGGNPVEAAMAGVVPGLNDAGGMLPGGDDLVMAGVVEHLRERGISDGAIRELLNDDKVAQWEHDAAKRWKDEHMSDREWTKKWRAGDALAAKEMILADIILNSEIKGVTP